MVRRFVTALGAGAALTLGWLVLGVSAGEGEAPLARSGGDWPVWGGAGNRHYSPLSQIHRGNVKRLRQAWSWDSGEQGGLQTHPLVVEGVLYAYTPSQKVVALDAASGELLWGFDASVESNQPNRGLAWWSDGEESRLLAGVMSFVYALDPTTGTPIADFGDGGRLDLRQGLRDPDASVALTSPGAVFEDLLIVGGRYPETLPAAPGNVRAYDVRSGELRWSFHTIPHPGEYGHDTWPAEGWKRSGAANNWAGMVVDHERGLVFVPTGSAAFDFYGGDRVGDNLFANCLIALDARTGERRWHFQAVRHDIWDRDFPSAPVLVTLTRDGETVEAVAQTSKQGFVFLFDRDDGTPLFPIEYRDYPASDVPGEVTAKQQPLPTRPEPYSRQRLTVDMLTTRTPEAHAWALAEFGKMRSDGQFLPFTVDTETIIFPGFDGGAEWGGPAFDHETGVLYVNANEMAWRAALLENEAEVGARGLYLEQCSVCHGEDRAGAPPEMPSLVDVADRLDRDEVAEVIRAGAERMQGFPGLSDAELEALVDYLATGENQDLESGPGRGPSLPYRFAGYHRFLDPQGYPAIAPPWGTLNAIDLNTGEYRWKIPFGEYPELAAQGMRDTGSENYGGPIVTAGGLLFIGASNFDRTFRAFDKDTGALLWSARLPHSGNATPVTYEVEGRQFVAIAAGGGKDPRAGSGGAYVAFTLAE